MDTNGKISDDTLSQTSSHEMNNNGICSNGNGSSPNTPTGRRPNGQPASSPPPVGSEGVVMRRQTGSVVKNGASMKSSMDGIGYGGSGNRRTSLISLEIIKVSAQTCIIRLFSDII